MLWCYGGAPLRELVSGHLQERVDQPNPTDEDWDVPFQQEKIHALLMQLRDTGSLGERTFTAEVFEKVKIVDPQILQYVAREIMKTNKMHLSNNYHDFRRKCINTYLRIRSSHPITRCPDLAVQGERNRVLGFINTAFSDEKIRNCRKALEAVRKVMEERSFRKAQSRSL